MTLREKLSKILALITIENVDKSIITFNKGVQEFSKNMDSITKEFSGDISKSRKKGRSESKKNQKNIEKLFGSSKSNVKIWSDKKSKESLF